MAKGESEFVLTTVSLEEGQLGRLRQIAGREYLESRHERAPQGQGRPSVSAVIRRAVDSYLKTEAGRG